MALFHISFYSEVLDQDTQMYVIIPQKSGVSAEDSAERSERLHPTLYLLHGMGSDYTSWLRRTSIERYAAAKGLAVVMPDVQQGWYTDMAYGPRTGLLSQRNSRK